MYHSYLIMEFIVRFTSPFGYNICAYSDKEIQKTEDVETGIITLTGLGKIEIYYNGVHKETYYRSAAAHGIGVSVVQKDTTKTMIAFGEDAFKNDEIVDKKEREMIFRFCGVPYDRTKKYGTFDCVFASDGGTAGIGDTIEEARRNAIESKEGEIFILGGKNAYFTIDRHNYSFKNGILRDSF